MIVSLAQGTRTHRTAQFVKIVLPRTLWAVIRSHAPVAAVALVKNARPLLHSASVTPPPTVQIALPANTATGENVPSANQGKSRTMRKVPAIAVPQEAFPTRRRRLVRAAHRESILLME